MNGFPIYPNGNYQYHNNNVQSQVYPSSSQNIDNITGYYDTNYDIQHQNFMETPLPKNLIGGQLPENASTIYSNNQSYYSGQLAENPTVVPVNYGYQNQMLTTHPTSVKNTTYQNIPPTIPLSGSYPTPHLPQFQPQINNYAKQSQSSQPSGLLADHMKNMQLNSSPLEHTIDLMQTRNLFDDNSYNFNAPKTCFPTNCDANVIQCTLNTLPIESNLLSKCRLPLGIHIQPFRDTDITLVQTNTIVRCRSCRTYINPFVTLTDHQRRWHCNVCGRVNDIPDEFMYDPITKTYGSPMKRPELMHSNIEFTANPDYTLRPPMATIYVFCLDVSQTAITSGYLRHTCNLLIENLDKMPGDSRRQIAFLTYNCSLHFYQIHDNSFKAIVWSDISEVDIPVSEDLLININDRKEIIIDFLRNLPTMFPSIGDTGNCLGYALQVAMKLISHNGGRITVVNASLPNIGPGSLTAREGKGNDAKLLQPSTDFYKSLALQCANEQISVDLFCINRQYTDIASFSTIARHSSGGFYYYGNFRAPIDENQRLDSLEQVDFDRYCKDMTRYLTRKLGLEAVMRTRCSKGLELTAFHGNLFMRSTNVILLPIVNPDASYAIQFKINGNLTEWKYVIIQSALLYTTSESDRRIRVHTICLPVTDKLEQVFLNANSPAIAAFIAKIAIDKCVTDGLQNVREAFVNSLVDPLKAFNGLLSSNHNRGSTALLCPYNLRLLAPFVNGLLRNRGFRARKNSTVDEQVAMLESLRWLPVTDSLRRLYVRLVPVPVAVVTDGDDSNDRGVPGEILASVCASSASISRDCVYMADVGHCVYVIVGSHVADTTVRHLLGHESLSHIPRQSLVIDCGTRCHTLRRVHRTMTDRSLGTTMVCLLPDDTALSGQFLDHLVDDRAQDSMSYYEFLKSIQVSVCGQ